MENPLLSGKMIPFDLQTPYTIDRARADMGDIAFWGDPTRADLTSQGLRIKLLKNALANGGFIARVKIPEAPNYAVNFEFMFDQGFDFSAGGKVGFGFLIGKGQTGGEDTSDGTGGSARLMWITDSNKTPFIQPYIYHKNQTGKWGDYMGKRVPVKAGLWNKAQILVKTKDNWCTILINGVKVLDQKVVFTTNGSLINNLCFETFRGGSESYWQSPNDGYIFFRNLKLTRI